MPDALTWTKPFLSGNIQFSLGLAKVLVRALAVVGGSSNQEALASQLRPPGGNSQLALDSMRSLDAMGVVRLEGQNVALTPGAVGRLASDEGPAFTTEQFRRAFLRDLLDHTCTQIAEANAPAMPLAISWLLSFDRMASEATRYSEGARVDSPENALRELQLQDLVLNVDQWRILMRWTTDLGFTQPLPGPQRPIITQPLIAIAAELPPAGKYSARGFLTELATSLPVLPGGLIHSAVMPEESSPVPQAVAAAMHALPQLVFAAPDDALPDERVEAPVFLSGRPWFSSVVVESKPAT